MKNCILAAVFFMSAPLALGASTGSVQVIPPDVHGSRPVETATGRAVVRDYLQAWEGLQSALSHNSSPVLSRDFIGSALNTLTQTVDSQRKLGISTAYENLSHQLQIVFYSPNGLSIQLVDTVSYEEVLLQNGKPIGSKQMQNRYIAVLTPTATRWMVRVLQGTPASGNL